MSWLDRSFNEHTIIWLIVSTVVGGSIGAAVTFAFEDLLRPWLVMRRDTGRLMRKYTTPLLRSAERLETRINIVIRNADAGWYGTDEYFRVSTLFIFAEYLAWVRIIERELGFIRMESENRDREFNVRFNGFFRAMSSFSYFRWHADPGCVSASEVPRLMCTAIGEIMTPAKDAMAVLEFTEFVDRYGSGWEFQRWFRELDHLLKTASPREGIGWDRLIAAAANLRALCWFLDPHGRMVARRPLANIDRLVNPEVRAQIDKDISHLFPRPAGPRRILRERAA